MRVIVTLALVVALALLSLQTWLTWSAREEPARLSVEARKLTICGDLGAASADFTAKAAVARREASRGPLGVRTYELLREAPRELNRTLFLAGYLLPETMADDLEEVRGASQRAVTAAFGGDGGAMQRALDDLEAASTTIQQGCRALVEAGPFGG